MYSVSDYIPVTESEWLHLCEGLALSKLSPDNTINPVSPR